MKFILKVALPLTLIILIPYSLVLSPVLAADSTETNEEVFYYLNDHLGGIDAVIDENGTVVERTDYLPFGDERLTIGDADEDYGYTGKEKDDESGLNYYGARYYDSKLARFTQLDPLVMNSSAKSITSVLQNPQALNGYSYVLNNPLKFVDERGLYAEDVHYDLTYDLCTTAGLRNDQAKIIAFQDQYVDDNPETAPSFENLSTNYQVIVDNHFQSRGEAAKRLDKALESGNLSDFGAALHTYQDSYSHEGLTPITHIGEMHDPDYTYKSPMKAYLMAKSTFFKVRRLNAETNGTGKLSRKEYDQKTVKIWLNKSKEVKSYLGLENKKGTNIEKKARESEKKK